MRAMMDKGLKIKLILRGLPSIVSMVMNGK